MIQETVTDKVFEEIREAAVKVWSKYDDFGGYRSEKLATVNRLQNVGDNWSYLIGMLDIHNKHELYTYLTEATRLEIFRKVEALNAY